MSRIPVDIAGRAPRLCRCSREEFYSLEIAAGDPQGIDADYARVPSGNYTALVKNGKRGRTLGRRVQIHIGERPDGPGGVPRCDGALGLRTDYGLGAHRGGIVVLESNAAKKIPSASQEGIGTGEVR